MCHCGSDCGPKTAAQPSRAIAYNVIRDGAVIPEYKTTGSAGFDLAVVEDTTVFPGETVYAPTGLVIQTPADHMLMVVPRSSSHKRWGLSLANTIGIVDEDYCGPEDEMTLALKRDADWSLAWNSQLIFKELFEANYERRRETYYTIPAGTRLAQGIFVPISRATFIQSEEPLAKSRGGWGSTGVA